jgi:acetylornithine deacetylase/succinyl-diaminopimelate desuccinylase-like protein/glyoxylase-like metal-dependent hydrolase (beta-lactamase superfamily II)
MWIGHTDVVEARPEDWSLPPFTFTEKEGWFYGRGTSDMKDQDAAMIASLIRLRQEGYVPARDIIVAFTADEEVGLEQDGVPYLLKAHPELVDAGLVINPDGSSGEIVGGERRTFGVETSQKTYMTFLLETTNPGGHSSEPRPENAIYQLAAGLVRLGQYPFPFKLNATTRLYFRQMAALESGQRRADMLAVAADPPDLAAAARLARDVTLNPILHTTCVATMLAAGHQENALPQRAQATVQCRVMPGETIEETRDTLARVVADPGIRVTLGPPVIPAPESPPTRAVLGAVENVVHSMWPGVPVIPQMAAGASDNIYTRAAGIPSYGVSGAWEDFSDDRAHGRDERREVSAFYESVEFTYRLMKELGGGAAAAGTASLREQQYAQLRRAFCPAPGAAPRAAAGATATDLYIEPTRVFDDLYFVGDRATSAWALTTSAGIILLDAGFHYNVEGTIVGGMKKLGLDPATIKYVIVSHGHNDHFGGARYLQQTYGARIVMSEADWTHMVTWPQRGSPAPYPDRDIVVKDGDEIRLGGTTVRIVVTPGHTPGTISPIFPVTDGAQTHRVGYWGGDGAGYLPPEEIRTYLRSADRFMDLDPAVDVELSNHVVADGTLLKLPLLKTRKPGDPHPFVAGNAAFREWVGVLKSCAGTFLEQPPKA